MCLVNIWALGGENVMLTKGMDEKGVTYWRGFSSGSRPLKSFCTKTWICQTNASHETPKNLYFSP